MDQLEIAKIIVKHRVSYGKHYFDPVNELAFKLLEFVNPNPKKVRKVFSEKQLKIGKEIGMIIEIQPSIVTYKGE